MSGFRHFVRNRRDPLFRLTDAGVHRRCFVAWPLRERALSRIEERGRRVRERVCGVCGEEITGDWWWTDHLTDDVHHPLYRFNYLHFHGAHLSEWAELPVLVELLERFVASGEYEGPAILPGASPG